MALRDIANMGIAGFGVGAGARGLYGLFNLINRRRGPEEVRPVGRIETEFPVEEDEEGKSKLAGAPPVEMLPSESGVLAPSHPTPTQAAPPIGGAVVGDDDDDIHLAEAKQAGYFEDLISGEKAQSKTGIPYYLAGTIGAGTGGAYGGWKLMDMLLDRRRMSAQEDDLEKAREDFQQALISRHSRGKKASADNTLGEDLDLLFDTLSVKCAALEKKAQNEGTPGGNALGTILGLYTAYAGGTGLLGGVLMYNAAKKRQRRALLEKAKEERERQRFEKQPPRIEFTSFMPPKAPAGVL